METTHLDYRVTPDCELLTVRPHELFELLGADPKHPHNRDYWRGLTHGYSEAQRGISVYDATWAGASTEQAARMRDWPEGRRLMGQYRVDLEHLPAVRSIKRVRRWSDNGDEFSRDRFDAGYADCWSARTRSLVRTGCGIVHVTIAFGGNCMREAAELAWGGAAAALVVDRLEDAGYRCEVTAMACSYGLRRYRHHRPDAFVTRIPLKAADEPLDIDRVLLVTGCPAFFRHHIFRSWLEIDGPVTDYLGVAGNPPESLFGDVHFSQVFSWRDAQDQIDRVIARFQGVDEGAWPHVSVE